MNKHKTKHEIKILPQYYEAVSKGDKRFELRKDDRDYQVGDIIKLREWDGKAKEVVNAIKKYNYDTAVIVLMNPNDLEEMSKCDFPAYKFAHAHFVAKRAIERGKIIVLCEDSSLKRAMYELIKEHPEKEWSWKE